MPGRLKYGWMIDWWGVYTVLSWLYGVAFNQVFCGESMFSLERDASKFALFHLVEKLKLKTYKLIDCQMYTPHLEKLGAQEIPRNEFLNYLIP